MTYDITDVVNGSHDFRALGLGRQWRAILDRGWRRYEVDLFRFELSKSPNAASRERRTKIEAIAEEKRNEARGGLMVMVGSRYQISSTALTVATDEAIRTRRR